MSDIFLRTVELSNFRVYGDSYAFQLPDEPGITLITGGNGLGKTSFFDGVEWALTGQVSRFSDIAVDGRRRELDPLTRIGASADSHRVSLAFTGAPPIDRGDGFVPDEQAITSLLKASGWPEISQLHGYLSITHFLGQASTRRFSVREPKAQWEALKGPAGVDRINMLRQRVSGQGARQAFTRAIRERSQSLEKARTALDTWQALVADRDRLARLAGSEQSTSPDQIRRGVERLARQLLALQTGLTWSAVAPTEEPEFALGRLSNLIEMVSQGIANEAALCHDLDRIFVDYDRAVGEASATDLVIQELTERRNANTKLLAVAEAAVSQAAATHANSEQIAAQTRARAGALARVAHAIVQLNSGAAELSAIDQQLDISRLECERAEARLSEAQQQRVVLQERRIERNQLAQARTLAEQRVRLSSALAAVRSELQRLAPLAASSDAATLRSIRASLGVEQKRIVGEIGAIEGDLRRHDDRARLLADAVSLIAHQLTHDDQRCPVCATTFEPGKLIELAFVQTNNQLASASTLATSLIDAKERHDAITRELADLDRRIVEHEQLVSTLASEQAREANLVQQLVQAEGVADQNYDGTEVQDLINRVSQIDAGLNVQPSESALRVLAQEAQATLDAERVKRAGREQRKSGVLSDMEAARSLLAQHSDLWTVDGGLLVELDKAQEQIERDARAIGDQLALEATALDKVRIERDALTEAISRDESGLARSRENAAAIADRRRKLVVAWTEAKQPGEPARGWIAQLQSQVAERQRSEQLIVSAQGELSSGLRRWQNDRQLQDRESALKAGMNQRGQSSIESVAALLEHEVVAAQTALEVAQSARSRMEEIGSALQTRAENFSDEVLKPLNDAIQRFARPLMTWTDASIIYRAEHHATRSELRPAILRAGADGSMTKLEMNPNLYFSEGQLSALSVSALLAASTTFAWSKWKGLLLDDPLQHNDVIHASAFMDLLRQMVRELRYQVILSTHDSSEADFFVRKCRCAGIKYAVHELVPQGDDGLVSVAA